MDGFAGFCLETMLRQERGEYCIVYLLVRQNRSARDEQ